MTSTTTSNYLKEEDHDLDFSDSEFEKIIISREHELTRQTSVGSKASEKHRFSAASTASDESTYQPFKAAKSSFTSERRLSQESIPSIHSSSSKSSFSESGNPFSFLHQEFDDEPEARLSEEESTENFPESQKVVAEEIRQVALFAQVLTQVWYPF
jgi:hypothetical protein